ncbi:MAG: 2-hydroxyglutaryl-CoA dehydratase [Acidobacteria bacterium]|nr:MAG: 2-hydroxyglutaryl-CoA dehydratase [Acidobacteriota bacterium]
MITCGIDIGSVTAKGVIMDENNLLATTIQFTGYNAGTAGETVLQKLLGQAGLKREQIVALIATGYGRNSVDFADKTLSEIICHGAGAHFAIPTARTVIDIGGQDSKVILLSDAGQVLNFVMNDKCAAGTGRFLEVMARALETDLDGFGQLSLKGSTPAAISSTCTVFAESEVISLVAKGESRENIIAGIHRSIAARTVAMANRVGLIPDIVMTGGVSRNIGVIQALEKLLNLPVTVPENAQLTGAIGAALLAQRAPNVA